MLKRSLSLLVAMLLLLAPLPAAGIFADKEKSSSSD